MIYCFIFVFLLGEFLFFLFSVSISRYVGLADSWKFGKKMVSYSFYNLNSVGYNISCILVRGNAGINFGVRFCNWLVGKFKRRWRCNSYIVLLK